MTDEYAVGCTCGAVQFKLRGEPRVRGFCHCGDCRELLDVPYHSVTAWEQDQLSIERGSQHVAEYQHPTLSMRRYYCRQCGESLFNSNARDWRIVSQLLISKAYGGRLPAALQSQSHFFYGRRVVDVDDELPKHE